MVLDDRLEGKYVYLRFVNTDDAAFICDIRNDNNLNKYVHAVSPDIKAQKEWIRKQMSRENDYYFVVCSNEGLPIGLASIYDVDHANGQAEFGRWVSRGNALQNVETAVLAFDFAFDKLGIQEVYMRTMMANSTVRNFWNHFGAISYGEIHEMGLALDKQVVTAENYHRELRAKSIKLLRW